MNIYPISLISLTLFTLNSCGSLPHETKTYIQETKAKASTQKINWPTEYEPSTSAFFVHNQIEIEAPPKVVWDLIIHAEDWSNWYIGASDIMVKTSDEGKLSGDAIFTWKTMGQRFESHVKEFAPYGRLAWESRKTMIQGYHAWLILPTENGCRVITDESFNGFLGTMQKWFIPSKLHGLHETFLIELKKKAETKSKR
ncbi:MAG: SRPBCC domain-containing protein [Verrucomicrobia bacterium]|jgi:hypothetical protein|nr:MAG: SRPBCC domain-containing protein [Verrucomicrobiota bacterium]